MLNKKRFSKISLLISLLLPISWWNNYITAEETFKKEKNIGESIKSNEENSLKKIKANQISYVANNSAEKSNGSRNYGATTEFLRLAYWCLPIAYMEYKSCQLDEKEKTLLRDLYNTKTDLHNKFVNLEHHIRNADLEKISEIRNEISKIITLENQRLKYTDKIIALLSHLDNDTICSINDVFSVVPKKDNKFNKLNNIISYYLISNPSFFCCDLFEDFFLSTLDDKLQREYAGLLYLVAVIMHYQCQIFNGKCQIREFFVQDFQKMNALINSNESLHVEKIELNKMSITIKTKGIPNKDNIKIFIPSDKADHFKIEFNSSQQ